MTFFDFYSSHFVPLTIVFALLIILLVAMIVAVSLHLFKNRKVKTPWFEIAPDSVKEPESEASGKTRLLISRQLTYIENYIDGLQPIFLKVTKSLVDDALDTLLNIDNVNKPKYHLVTRFIQTASNSLSQNLINYLGHLLVVNHIGTDKEKIRKYAKGHVNQILGIVKKSMSEVYCDLSGQVCLDSTKYWKSAGIEDPMEFAFNELSDLLINISYLRYSDFDSTNDTDNSNTSEVK